jgi:hypothetical protein
MQIPLELRARLQDQYDVVRPLPSPWMRALWIVPLAVITVAAAPVAFDVRADASQLGWMLGWGASLLQVSIGFAIIAASLRESIPGRGWSRGAIALWLTLPIALVILVTLASWESSRILLQRGWWVVAGVCFAGSAASALPVVALASVLTARAYPTRPAITGAMLGAGAGLMADAGWRMFCHFTEPSHVLSAHLGGVVMSTVMGVLLTLTLRRPRT